mgnify:CR=1 FL=1
MLCGLTFLDAIDTSFSTIATGGFSTKDASIAYYNNPVLELVIAFFMIISSANFGIYVEAWKRGVSVIWKDTEFRTYLAIVAIATPSAQAVVAATKSVPVVFSAVTDPVAAKLVPSMEPSKTNVAGVSDVLALDKQIELIKQVVPGAKRIGMVYNPGEANSMVVVKELQKLLPSMGLTLVEAAAPRSVDVSSAARSLIGKVDVIYTSTDNNVVSAYEALVKVGQDAKIPLVASDTDSVKRGAIAALGINYRDLGEQTGRMVVRILKGEKPGEIKSETSSKLELFVNPGAAEKQGVKLSDALIKSAAQVVQ